MEGQHSNPEVTTAFPAPPLATYTYTYPPNYNDTIATNYVHSLNSSPYYYFIPHYTTNPHYYAYNNVIQYGFPRVISTPNNNHITHDNNISVRPPQYYTSPRTTYHDHNENHRKLNELGDDDRNENVANSSSNIDGRILNILEPFRQLYSEREQTLKIIFPGLYAKLSDFFKKVNSLILAKDVEIEGERRSGGGKGRTLKRSISRGGESSYCKNERFRVRPIDAEDTLMISSEDKGF